MADEPLTYNIPQAARALGVSQWTVKRLIADGLLPLVPHTGRRRLISRKRLAEWVDQNPSSVLASVHDRTSVVHAGRAVPATDSAGRSHQEKGHGTAARSEDTQSPGSVTPPYGAGTPPVEPAHASTTAGLPGATRAAS